MVLDRIRDLLAADPEVAAVGQVASVYLGPHQLLVTAEIQPLDAISGVRLRQLLAELRGRVAAAIPRAALVFLTRPSRSNNPRSRRHGTPTTGCDASPTTSRHDGGSCRAPQAG